jgi:beta-glucosidase
MNRTDAPSASPTRFLWGVATAAHQVEGQNIHSDWWDWEKLPGKVKKNEHSGLACDHWGRFEEDLGLMRELGVNAYRFSVEWAKIEPREGEIDSEAVAHYRKVVRLLHDAGIEPLLTLHHFTSPRWWAEKGYWSWEGTSEAFAKYARLVYREIAPTVRSFCTVNEPMVHLGGAYVMGLTPPEKRGFEHLRDPLVGMLRAHVSAYEALHDEAKKAGRTVAVGMAHHCRLFDPKRKWNPVDILAARALDRSFNWTVPNALETGRVAMKIPGIVAIDEEVPGLKGTQDYYGLNYYSRDLVTIGRNRGRVEPVPMTKKGRPTNDLGWELYPKGFGRALREVYRRFPRLKIVVTENGIADAKDANRAKFIADHLAEMERAIADGVPVVGYCHWSLMDNFEWIEGFDPRFGLVEIDYATLARKMRPSAAVYRDWIREHRAAPKP